MFRKANGLNEFYSVCNGNPQGGVKIHLHIDEQGNPTIDYPHVHLIHHANGKVDILASVAKGEHPWRTTLANPSGQEVEAAVRKATGFIEVRSFGLLGRGGTKRGMVEFRRAGDKFLCLKITWQGCSINSVSVTPRDPTSGRPVTFVVGQLFESVWGPGATHNLTSN